MVFRQLTKLSLAVLFISATLPGFSQVAPEATQRTWPLEIGGGLSYFSNYLINARYPTYNYLQWNGDLLGPVAWADWTFTRIPHRLYGLGIEVEGRDLRHSNSGPAAKLREDTGAGGVIYMWRHYRKVHPYGKFLMGYGSVDFQGNYPLSGPYPGCQNNCDHDSDSFYDLGGGAEVHIMGSLWARADYEAEYWTHFGNDPSEEITPKGFTLGVSYDMRNFHIGRQKPK